VAVLATACIDDDAADPPPTTEASAAPGIVVSPRTEAELGSALEDRGLGCSDVAEMLPSNATVNGSECTISGETVVLLVFDDAAAQREYLSGKPEELCFIALMTGVSDAVMVVGDGWTARPESGTVAAEIAEATDAELMVADCEPA
jgi:hypothetical protein